MKAKKKTNGVIKKGVTKMANELMNKQMTDDELENVVGGKKVVVLFRNVWPNFAIGGDYQGDMDELIKHTKQGNFQYVDQLMKNSKGYKVWHHVNPQYIDKLKERWEKRGYEVIVHDIKQ